MNLNPRKRPKQYIKQLILSACDGSLFPFMSKTLNEANIGGFKALGRPRGERNLQDEFQLYRSTGTVKYKGKRNPVPYVFYPSYITPANDYLATPILERWYNSDILTPGDLCYYDSSFMTYTEPKLFGRGKNKEKQYYIGYFHVCFKPDTNIDSPIKVKVSFQNKFISDVAKGDKQLSDVTSKDIKHYSIGYGSFTMDKFQLWTSTEDTMRHHSLLGAAAITKDETNPRIVRSYYVDNVCLDEDEFHDDIRVSSGKLKAMGL